VVWVRCRWCGFRFEYGAEGRVVLWWVSCPRCGSRLVGYDDKREEKGDDGLG